MADVAHACPKGHHRGTAYCGIHQQPCDPVCAGCGHDLRDPDHPAH